MKKVKSLNLLIFSQILCLKATAMIAASVGRDFARPSLPMLPCEHYSVPTISRHPCLVAAACCPNVRPSRNSDCFAGACSALKPSAASIEKKSEQAERSCLRCLSVASRAGPVSIDVLTLCFMHVCRQPGLVQHYLGCWQRQLSSVET